MFLRSALAESIWTFCVLRLWCQLALPFNVRELSFCGCGSDMHNVWLCWECWKVAMSYFCELQFDRQVTNFCKILCSLQNLWKKLVLDIMLDVHNHILCQASCEIFIKVFWFCIGISGCCCCLLCFIWRSFEEVYTKSSMIKHLCINIKIIIIVKYIGHYKSLIIDMQINIENIDH